MPISTKDNNPIGKHLAAHCLFLVFQNALRFLEFLSSGDMSTFAKHVASGSINGHLCRGTVEIRQLWSLFQF